MKQSFIRALLFMLCLVIIWLIGFYHNSHIELLLKAFIATYILEPVVTEALNR